MSDNVANLQSITGFDRMRVSIRLGSIKFLFVFVWHCFARLYWSLRD